MERVKIILLIINLTLFLILEYRFPFFEDRGLGKKLFHDWKNLVLGGVNSILSGLIFTSLYLALFRWSSESSVGLLNNFELTPPLRYLIGFILIDLWLYIWHRLNHTLPFLWRFHSVHHTDHEMDSTSFIRFHPVEIMLSGLLKLPVLLIAGLDFEILLIHEIALNFSTVFHHSNVALPEYIDYYIRLFVVSPNMHRLHHSEIIREGNSNYSTTFSFWDRLFGSYIEPLEPGTIKLGVKGYEGKKWQTLPGMLLTPFRRPE